MDDLTVYGNSFGEALSNLKNVLQCCQDMNISPSNEKCSTLMNEGMVLEHYISSSNIEVDPTKVVIIHDL
jgi:hypothetical protein